MRRVLHPSLRTAQRRALPQTRPRPDRPPDRRLPGEPGPRRGDRADIAVEPARVEPADIVVLNRVVCCYPDYERLLGAVAVHARRVVVFSHPPRNLVSRVIVAGQNLGFRLLRREFRVFTHPPDGMLAALERRGLRLVFAHRGIPWEIAGLES